MNLYQDIIYPYNTRINNNLTKWKDIKSGRQDRIPNWHLISLKSYLFKFWYFATVVNILIYLLYLKTTRIYIKRQTKYLTSLNIGNIALYDKSFKFEFFFLYFHFCPFHTLIFFLELSTFCSGKIYVYLNINFLIWF